MEESIVERVLILMKDYELTASEFADKIDVQRSSMSHLVSGRNKPSLDFIQKILNNFSDLNPTWLIMGTGPMKQLDIFDIKGAVAPIQPIPAEKFRIESPAGVQAQATKNAIVEEQFPMPDAKKVIYEQVVPTLAAIQGPAESIQAEKPKEELVQVPDPPIPASSIPIAPIPTPQPVITPLVSQVPIQDPKINYQAAVQTEKSIQNDKKVVKIVFFYSDNTFETFNPQ